MAGKVMALWMMILTPRNSGTAMAFSIGLMEPTTKGNGSLIRQRARAHFGMLKEMSIMETLKTIWPMAMASIHTSTDPSIKESSKTMYRRVMVRKNGLTAPNTLART